MIIHKSHMMISLVRQNNNIIVVDSHLHGLNLVPFEVPLDFFGALPNCCVAALSSCVDLYLVREQIAKSTK